MTSIKASLTTADSTGFDADVKYHASAPGSSASVFDASNYFQLGSSLVQTKTGNIFTDGSGGTQTYYDMDEDSFVVVEVPSGGGASDNAAGLKVWLIGYWR